MRGGSPREQLSAEVWSTGESEWVDGFQFKLDGRRVDELRATALAVIEDLDAVEEGV
jgi:hypothetical protein